MVLINGLIRLIFLSVSYIFSRINVVTIITVYYIAQDGLSTDFIFVAYEY